MKKHLHSADEEVKTLRIDNQDLKDHVCKLEAESGQMQEDINNLEQYGRRECLEFQGLSWEESENTDQLVISVSKLLQIDLSAKDMSVSHRLSPASESNRQPTIIARFWSRRIRDLVDIGCVLITITRTILKHAYLLTKASPKPTVVASTNGYGSKRKTTSSLYGQRME